MSSELYVHPLIASDIQEILGAFTVRLRARWPSVRVFPALPGAAILCEFALPLGPLTLDCWLDRTGTLCMDGATDAEYAELIVWYRSLFPPDCDLGVDNPGGSANEVTVTRCTTADSLFQEADADEE